MSKKVYQLPIHAQRVTGRPVSFKVGFEAACRTEGLVPSRSKPEEHYDGDLRKEATGPAAKDSGPCQRRQALQDSGSAHEEASVQAGCAHRGAAQGPGVV